MENDQPTEPDRPPAPVSRTRWPRSRIAGVVALGSILGLCLWFVAGVLHRIEQRTRRMDVPNDLKVIGGALHNHQDANGSIPAAFARSRGARPPMGEVELANRLSWRYDLLPFLEHRETFDRMNPDEPWDGPTNRRFADTPVKPYTDPDDRANPATRYRVFYGPQTAFPPEGQTRIPAIADGASNTIFVIETRDKVTWSRFGELPFDPNAPPDPASFGREQFEFFYVLMFDGSVRQVQKSVNPATLKAAITPAGGEPLGSDW